LKPETPLDIVKSFLDAHADACLTGIVYVRPEKKKETPKTFSAFKKASKPYYKLFKAKYENTFPVPYQSGDNIEHSYHTAVLQRLSKSLSEKAIVDSELPRTEYGIFTDLGSIIAPCVDLAGDISLLKAASIARTMQRSYQSLMKTRDMPGAHIFSTGNSWHIWLDKPIWDKDIMNPTTQHWYHSLLGLPGVDQGWVEMLFNSSGKSGILRLSAGPNNRHVPRLVMSIESQG